MVSMMASLATFSGNGADKTISRPKQRAKKAIGRQSATVHLHALQDRKTFPKASIL